MTGAIVCATGNGDASRIVQRRAVEMARDQKKKLVFLHIVDVARLGELDPALIPAAQREMAWLGKAVLQLAEERARRQGVDATFAIRFGQVLPELERFVKEERAALLLLGQPTNDALLRFAQTIEGDTGVPVQLVTTG